MVWGAVYGNATSFYIFIILYAVCNLNFFPVIPQFSITSTNFHAYPSFSLNGVPFTRCRAHLLNASHLEIPIKQAIPITTHSFIIHHQYTVLYCIQRLLILNQINRKFSKLRTHVNLPSKLLCLTIYSRKTSSN